MRQLGCKGTLAVLALAAVSMLSVGCNNDKEQLAALQADYNSLANQNKDLRGQLSQAKTREAELLTQLDAKDMQLAAKERELANAGTATPAPTGGNWDVGKNADRVTVGSDILFDSGNATLTSKGKSALDQVIRDLKANYAGMPVRVYGYTDSDPIKKTKNLWQDNLDLSANRAMAVTRYLMDNGIQAENVETVAMGATHFVAKNDNTTSKAKNRRVEIVVIKQ